MLTTGFKLFFGFAVAAAAATLLFGYTSGGNWTGPISLGWKEGIGDHVGFLVLLFLAVGSGLLGVMLVSFRDADPESAAELLGTSSIPRGQAPVTPTIWPFAAAVAVGTVMIGLIVHPAVFVAGLVVLAAVLFEWMIEAWAARATGDPEVNRDLRNRLMNPIEVPALAFGTLAVLILAVSRIFLSVSATAAVFVAMGVSGLVLVGAIILNFKPTIPKNAVAGAVLVCTLGVLVGGIVAASVGEREFHPHEEQGLHDGDTGLDEGEG